MPTPSKPLHLGHAWLVFIMQAWMRTLREQGFVAEFVLMFDVRTNDVFERSRALSQQVIEEILADFEMMGVTPDQIIRNENPTGDEKEVAELAKDPIFSAWKQKYDFFAEHFLSIAAWDRKLGVTHIVRGYDRLPYDSAYEECYRKLLCHPPQRLYVPVLLNDVGERISFNDSKYLVSEMMQQYTRADLEAILLHSCLAEPGNWSDLCCPEKFFAKLAPEPRIVLP